MNDTVEEVDEHDRPTGRLVARIEACRDGSMILHRCVCVYAFDIDGRMHVQTHKKTGLYDHSVGGHVDAGEGYAAAARREAAEELGIVGVPLHEIGTGLHSVTAARQHMFGIYECFLNPAWKFVPNDEVEEVTPMTLAELVELMNHEPMRFTGGFINTLKYYLQKKNLPLTVRVDAYTKRPIQ